MTGNRPGSSHQDEFDYLRRVELLARELVGCAHDEGWLSYMGDPDGATPLQRAANELARTLRHHHFEGDGCIEERPTLGIGGAGLIRPGSDGYAEICGRLGVEARTEGWALWHTWDTRQRAHTLVTMCIATTEGLFANWARGIGALPSEPDRAQVIAVIRGWIDPVVLHPDHARDRGLGGA